MAVLLEAGEEMRNDPEYEGWITDSPVVLGADRFTETGIIIKFMVEVRPDKVFPTRRELLRRIKKKFDEEGIEIAVPYLKVIRRDGEG